MATRQASVTPVFVANAPAVNRVARRWLRSRNLLIGVGIIGALALVGIFARYLTPYDPLAQDYKSILLPPSAAHPFGTDNFGRDVLSRVLHGARIDLRIGFTAVIAPFVIGIILGCLSGYFGGWIDTTIMRLVDVVLAFPFIVLIVAIVAVLGPGINNMYIAVALTAWVVYARLIRSEILVVKKKEYIEAAHALGMSNARIIVKHILPNVINASIVYAMADIALYIGFAAALSYLGLGAKPPAPEWGVMITEGQPFITTAWWMCALPGLALVITGIGLSLIGDGLSDARRPGAR
jgi:peptide/nickel transport system permease protein